jgi:hypothetical protein
VRRAALVALVLAALLVPGSARANGDPASDLNKTVADANAKGYPIRVAIIAFTGDLGTAGSLWGKPQPYAKFLWNELSFQYDKRLLVAMPAGFGVYDGTKPVDKELTVLKRVKPGTIPTDLTESAAEAVRQLAAADGVKVAKPSSGGSSTRDRILILVGALVVLALVLVFPTRWLRRGRGGGQSPSAEPR